MEAGSYEQDEASNKEPYVEITEQPASKSLRFRYLSDKTPGSAIPGVKSTVERRTSPTITIHNYTGHVIILAYCVTKEEPYRPHPHYLVNTRKERCHKGVWITHHFITETSKEYHLKHIGIQCVRKLDVAGALRDKKKIFDRYNIEADFSHMNTYQNIDLSTLRLCFQVITTDEKGLCTRALPPVVSDVMYNKSSLSNLKIAKTMPSSGPASGGTEVILLCDKLVGDDTKVVFYLEDNEHPVWEATAKTTLVHKHVAVVFETPAFRDLRIKEDVRVHFRLENGTDTSKPCEFVYNPDYRELQYKSKTISELLDLYSIDPEPTRVPMQGIQYSLQESKMARVSNSSNSQEMLDRDQKLQFAYEYVQDAQATVLGLKQEPFAEGLDERLLQEGHHMQQTTNTRWLLQGNEIPPTKYNPSAQSDLSLFIPNPVQHWHQAIPRQATSPTQRVTSMQQVITSTSPMPQELHCQSMSPMQQVTTMQRVTNMQQVLPRHPISLLQPVTSLSQVTSREPTPPLQQMTTMLQQQAASMQRMTTMQHVIPGQPTSNMQHNMTCMQQVIAGQSTSPMQRVAHNIQQATNVQQLTNTQWPPRLHEMPDTSYNMWQTSCSHFCNEPKLNGFQPNFDHSLDNTMLPESMMLGQQTTNTEQTNYSKMDTDSSGSISVSKLLTPEELSDILIELSPISGH